MQHDWAVEDPSEFGAGGLFGRTGSGCGLTLSGTHMMYRMSATDC